MATNGARAVGWKRFLRLAGALALPAIVVLGFGAATVHADGPGRCGGGSERLAHEDCGGGDDRCEPDGDCDRDHHREGQPAPGPRRTPGVTPTPLPATTPTPETAAAPDLAAAGATSSRSAVAGAGSAAAPAAASPAASPAAAPTATPSTSPAGVLPASLPPVRPAPVLVDLPLVRLLVVAVVVGVAAAVLPRAVRWPR